MNKHPQLRIAVVGTGIAGACCAHALVQAGHAVQVFDKARGPGGRLATRRAEWVAGDGAACMARLDHGAVGITARSRAFQGFVDQAVHAGWMAEWSPAVAPDSLPLDGGSKLYLPVPDMPELCRRLLVRVVATWSCTVDALHAGPLGWQLASGGERLGEHFDAVVLAIPPAQAAPLIGPHRRDWARHAALAAMQTCWTLMGVADAPEPEPGWDLARPSTGPLAWVLRSDARPGRERVSGQAHWVAHARAGWSRRHLEETPEWARQQLQAALADVLGHTVHWQYATAHRWRYAQPQSQRLAPTESCWWDAGLGLGVCGDFLGGAGAEGAWLSGRSLSRALIEQLTEPPVHATAPIHPRSLAA